MRLPAARLHVVPAMPWSAADRWRARPVTLLVLAAGLWAFGTGEALLVDSSLGNTPWTVLAEGISRHTPLSIGMSTFVVSVLVLLAWIPLRERPGLGTLANVVVIAVAIDVMLRVLPGPDATAGRLVEVAGAVGCIGIGSALYLTTLLGPGPRDGWMTGLARRTGRPIASVRLSIELTVLLLGWLLGGTVGVGTVVFALTIGWSVTAWMGALSAARS
jgi:uncharacterized protein